MELHAKIAAKSFPDFFEFQRNTLEIVAKKLQLAGHEIPGFR